MNIIKCSNDKCNITFKSSKRYKGKHPKCKKCIIDCDKCVIDFNSKDFVIAKKNVIGIQARTEHYCKPTNNIFFVIGIQARTEHYCKPKSQNEIDEKIKTITHENYGPEIPYWVLETKTLQWLYSILKKC